MDSRIKEPLMYDLVYDGGFYDEVKQAFPSAKIEDASDFIHEGRFSVELPDDKRREYLKFIIAQGIAPTSLMFLTDAQSPKHKDEIKDIIEEIEREKSVTRPETNTPPTGAERIV